MSAKDKETTGQKRSARARSTSFLAKCGDPGRVEHASLREKKQKKRAQGPPSRKWKHYPVFFTPYKGMKEERELRVALF